MSRIIKALLNSSQYLTSIDSAVLFLHPAKLDKDIFDLPYKLIVFQPHTSDSNNRLTVCNPQIVNDGLNFLPNVVICNDLSQYWNAKNLGNAIKLPVVNLIKEYLPIKAEMALDLARSQWINDINLVSSADIVKKLYITNYELINDLPQQILNKVNLWKHV